MKVFPKYSNFLLDFTSTAIFSRPVVSHLIFQAYKKKIIVFLLNTFSPC